MARQRTRNLPNLDALLSPPDELSLAVEQVLLRRSPDDPQAAPMAEQIAARLAGAITLDQIHAGQRLLESDISKAMGVSRAPVREALRILEKDRLVEYQPRRGAIVTAPDAAELRDIYAVRAILYEALLRQVLQDNPASLLAVFDEHMPRLRRAAARSLDAYALAGFLLNFAVFEACRNALLGDMLKSISLRTLRYLRMGLAHGSNALPDSMRSWKTLHEAIASGPPELIIATAQRRIHVARDAAIDALQEQAPARRSSSRTGRKIPAAVPGP